MNAATDKQRDFANTVKNRIVAHVQRELAFAAGRRPNTDRVIMMALEFGSDELSAVTRTDAEVQAAEMQAAAFDARVVRMEAILAQVIFCDDAKEILDQWQHVAI